MHHFVESCHVFSNENPGPFDIEAEAVNLRQRQMMCRFIKPSPIRHSLSRTSHRHTGSVSMDGRPVLLWLPNRKSMHSSLQGRRGPRLPGTEATIVARALGHMFGRSTHQVKSSFLSIRMPGLRNTINALLEKRHKPDFLGPVKQSG